MSNKQPSNVQAFVIALIFTVGLCAALYASSLRAAEMPTPDYKDCSWISQQAMRCSDEFGNRITCVLRETQTIIRWSCR